MQVVNVHLCRSRRTSVFSRPLFSNGLITAGIAAEIALILLIDYTAIGNSLFGTAPLGFAAWLVVLPFAMATVVLEEARKAIIRTREAVSASAQVREGARYRTSRGHA
jgi:magnesium-transporting ATPase (P-type)